MRLSQQLGQKEVTRHEEVTKIYRNSVGIIKYLRLNSVIISVPFFEEYPIEDIHFLSSNSKRYFTSDFVCEILGFENCHIGYVLDYSMRTLKNIFIMLKAN